MKHSYDHNTKYGKAFIIVITFNVCFVIFEIIYGLKANSLALIADGGHNMGDVVGLMLAWISSILAARAHTQQRTYGHKSSTILASLPML